MNAPHFSQTPSPRRSAPAGYTLVELMIAVALFALGSGIFYEAFITNFILSAKNTALNRGNTEIQTSYFKLLTSIENAATLVDCAQYNPTTQTFSPVTNGTWANSVRFMRLLPLPLYVLPDDNSGYTVANPPPPSRSVNLKTTATSVSLSFCYDSTNTMMINASGQAIGISSGARLYPAFPYVTQDVVGGKSPGTKKPGLAIQSINTSTSSKITLTMTTALGANAFKDCNRAFLMVESAFVVLPATANGLKSLVYIADTSLLGTANYKPTIISDSLDTADQRYPASGSTAAGSTSGSFCIPEAGDSLQTLLPIRSQEYGNNIKQRNTTWINLTTKFRERQNL